MGISLNHVDYTYQEGTPFEGRALFDVSLTIPSGSYTAFIGHTGSGKSTIMQMLNGLHLPTAGSIQVDDFQVTSETKSKHIRSLRKKVGLVFQFAETQLFAETVLKDVAFGPQNFGLSVADAQKIAKEKLTCVGIEESLWDKNPFELSGGQMRRVAIAGILALEPEILVLDEPTAGLDPKGRKELMQLFDTLHRSGLTIVLVTHVMDDVANYADQVYVMEKGHVVCSGSPQQVFQKVAFLREKQLGIPKITELAYNLRKKGWPMDQLPITIEAFKELIKHE